MPYNPLATHTADAIIDRWAGRYFMEEETRAALRCMVRDGGEAGWQQANGTKDDQQIIKDLVGSQRLIIDRLQTERDTLEAHIAGINAKLAQLEHLLKAYKFLVGAE